MKLDAEEIQAIADALVPRLVDQLERRLADSPQWAKSIPEAAAWCQIEEHVVRDAIQSGRLPAIRIGRSIRIRRCDLFTIHGEP